MREKLETLSLLQLRETAKTNGIKSVTTYRKSELIDKLVELYESQHPSNKSDSQSTALESPAEEIEEQELIQTDLEEQTDPDALIETTSDPVPNAAVYHKRSFEQDSPYSQKHVFSGIHGTRTRTPGYSRPAGPQRDTSSVSNTSGGYIPRNGGYAQSYNPVSPELSGSRPPRNSYRNLSDDTMMQNPGGYAGTGYHAQQRPYPAQTPYTQKRTPNPALSSYGSPSPTPYAPELASSEPAHGILEIINPDGFGFLRSENYLTGDNDVYVSPAQIRKFNMKTGDVIEGIRRVKSGSEKFAALLYVNTINGFPPALAEHRVSFEDLTPVFPNSRLKLETDGGPLSLRILDLLSPIGKGQRGMIVSPPKAGKTTLLKDIAKAITINYPDIRLIVLLIDERPEEVTDIKECIEGQNVEVIYSTFDEQPEHHKRVAEMVLERAKRLVEHQQDVVILLDSITRLARACNLTVTPSGRTLSGGLDPSALHMPKKFFGAARNMREGGSLTILASALVDTGSRMDDVVFEEFKGTGNMELVLDRKLSERRIFPAIDICRSGTRRDDLLLSPSEQEAVTLIRRNTASSRAEDTVERILDLFSQTKSNQEFIANMARLHLS